MEAFIAVLCFPQFHPLHQIWVSKTLINRYHLTCHIYIEWMPDFVLVRWYIFLMRNCLLVKTSAILMCRALGVLRSSICTHAVKQSSPNILSHCLRISQIPLYCDTVIVLEVNCAILCQPHKTPATKFLLLCEVSESCPHPFVNMIDTLLLLYVLLIHLHLYYSLMCLGITVAEESGVT